MALHFSIQVGYSLLYHMGGQCYGCRSARFAVLGDSRRSYYHNHYAWCDLHGCVHVHHHEFYRPRGLLETVELGSGEPFHVFTLRISDGPCIH